MAPLIQFDLHHHLTHVRVHTLIHKQRNTMLLEMSHSEPVNVFCLLLTFYMTRAVWRCVWGFTVSVGLCAGEIGDCENAPNEKTEGASERDLF